MNLDILMSAFKESFTLFWPEILVLTGIFLGLILDLMMKRSEEKNLIAYFSILVVLASLLPTFVLRGVAPRELFFGTLVVDGFGSNLKIILGLATLLTMLISLKNRELEPYPRGELYILYLSLYFSTMLLTSAINFLMFILAFEMVSVTSYILVAYRRKTRISIEAAIKYIVFGAASSGVMLYAISWIYGLTGTVTFAGVSQFLSTHTIDTRALNIILFLFFAGLAFKVSAVPFHFWAPDAYQGAATPITAFLTVVPKIAGFGALVRVCFHAFSTHHFPGDLASITWKPIEGTNWTLILAIFSVASMTWGNVVALWQKNIKRMLAYSSIGHAGYLFLGVLSLSSTGLRALLFYFFAYMLMNLGAFYVVIVLSDVVDDYETIDAYKGIGRQYPLLTLTMGFFMLSLAGIPPLIGFFGKFFLFASAIQSGWTWLAIIAVINSAISLFYYVNIIKVMVLLPPEERGIPALRPLAYRLTVTLAFLVFIMGILFGTVTRMTSSSLYYPHISKKEIHQTHTPIYLSYRAD